MAKYDPLALHLRTAARPCHMTFARIEDLVGPLPASARVHREWWANDRTHVQAQAWLSSRRAVGKVDLRRAIVRFD
jgi:hypothetical protein